MCCFRRRIDCQKESEILRRERDDLRTERDQYRQRQLDEQEEAEREFTGIEMVPQTALEEVEREKRNWLPLLFVTGRNETTHVKKSTLYE